MLPAQRQLAAPLNSEHRQRISSLGASTNPGAANQHASSPGIDSGEYTSISSEGRAGISLSFGSRMRPERGNPARGRTVGVFMLRKKNKMKYV